MGHTLYRVDTPPFLSAPDPAFFYESSSHGRAMTMLRNAVENDGEVALLTGSFGTGKTMVIEAFIARHGDALSIGLVENGGSSAGEPVHWALSAFGYDVRSLSAEDAMLRLQQVLGDLRAEGRRALLIVDEAQNLMAEDLDQLQQMLRMTSDGQLLLTLILVGLPELRGMLQDERHQTLDDLISMRRHLTALTPSETPDYLDYRLVVAGARRGLFSEDAARLIHDQSDGFPAQINQLARVVVNKAAADGLTAIDANFVAATLNAGLADGTLAHVLNAPILMTATDALSPPEAPEFAEAPAEYESQGVMSRAAEMRLMGLEPDPETGVRFEFEPMAPEAELVDDFEPRSDEVMAQSDTPPSSLEALAAEIMPRGHASDAHARMDALERAAGPVTLDLSGSADGARDGGADDAAPVIDLKLPDTDNLPVPVPEGDKATKKRQRGGMFKPAAIAAGLMLAAASGIGYLASGKLGTPTAPSQPATLAAAGAGAGVAVGVPVASFATYVQLDQAPSADALFRAALQSEPGQPDQAAIDYARAALRGHERAAYYLGQLYETGQGVPRAVTLARSWYQAAPGIGAASGRLDRIAADGDAGDALAPLAPHPQFVGRLPDGRTEVIWTAAAGPSPSGFVVETAAAKDGPVTRHETAQPALLLDGPVAKLRIVALGAGGEAATDWALLN